MYVSSLTSAFSSFYLLTTCSSTGFPLTSPDNFGCAAGNIGPNDECYGTAQKALKMPPSVRLISSGKGQNPDIYTGSGVQNAHPPNSPCREALKDWCCNPNGKRGDAGRLSWDPIAVMIAALDVGSVSLKEVNYGVQWTADADGAEHFFGSGTQNAQTDFTDGGSSPGKIVAAIDFYVNQVPGAPTPACRSGGVYKLVRTRV